METQFVPYELAVKLKELGFNEKCFSVYDTMGFHQDEREMNLLLLDYIKAPLWQQAFDWFRDKYNFNSWISGRKSMGYGYTINNVPNRFKNNILDTLESPHIYELYEQARYSCVEKLIELCK